MNKQYLSAYLMSELPLLTSSMTIFDIFRNFSSIESSWQLQWKHKFTYKSIGESIGGKIPYFYELIKYDGSLIIL